MRDCLHKCAPTGKASALISGNTLSALAGGSRYKIALAKLKKYWAGKWLVIIDEVYMVALHDLGITKQNIMTVVANLDIDIVLVGDP